MGDLSGNRSDLSLNLGRSRLAKNRLTAGVVKDLVIENGVYAIFYGQEVAGLGPGLEGFVLQLN